MTLNALHADAALRVSVKRSVEVRMAMRRGPRWAVVDGRFVGSSTRLVGREVDSIYKSDFVSATMRASLARWFQMGGTG
jgi:hypothetical protein